MFRKQYIPLPYACRCDPDYDIQDLYWGARIVNVPKGTEEVQKQTIDPETPGRS
jgi:hypothetical protein